MLLETQELVKTYGNRTVVKGVSFSVEQGEVVGLLGSNGAGKTTSFYMVVGIIRPSQGNIFLDGQKITKLPMHIRGRKGIGYLPQEVSIFRKLSVEDNILAILEMMKLTKKERMYRLDELLDDLQIQHIRKGKGISLSGGEKRRVEIARTLAMNPKFILLDEPFAGVDPIAVMDIQKVIQQLAKKNIGIFITDHQVRETLGITDRAYIMNEGKILVHGKPEYIIQNKLAKEIYLGKDFSL